MNYCVTNIAGGRRSELHDKLNLTGAEISVNEMPAGEGTSFVHKHRQNEEIYGILKGEGKFIIDGETIDLKAGDWIRVSPSAHRQLFASGETGMKYICIQVKENSLEDFSLGDGVIC